MSLDQSDSSSTKSGFGDQPESISHPTCTCVSPEILLGFSNTAGAVPKARPGLQQVATRRGSGLPPVVGSCLAQTREPRAKATWPRHPHSFWGIPESKAEARAPPPESAHGLHTEHPLILSGGSARTRSLCLHLLPCFWFTDTRKHAQNLI